MNRPLGQATPTVEELEQENEELLKRIKELDDALRKACALAECERWHERFPKCHAAMIKALEQKDESV